MSASMGVPSLADASWYRVAETLAPLARGSDKVSIRSSVRAGRGISGWQVTTIDWAVFSGVFRIPLPDAFSISWYVLG